MKRKIALALGACIILGSGGGAYAYAKNPVAYVSMDINPSIELGVNAFDKVVSIEAYNEDGKKILEGTNLINSNVSDAVGTVITNAISDGYITKDVTTTAAVAVEITTSTDKENVATKLNESLKEVADKTLDNNNVDVEVETEEVALARRDEARTLGITPGKLNLIQKLQALDPTITVEEYKSSSVKDIQKKTKELRKDNKSDETTTDNSTSTDVNNDANIAVVTEEDSNHSNNIDNKVNNDNDNDNDNNNDKKEEHSNANKENNNGTTAIQKGNNSDNANSQGNNNSLKLENSSNSKSKNNSSNSNSSKSENSGNGNSNSQNKDKNKNK
ncbi:MAG TPA: hypothetical protein VF839_02760 [Clostridium sp.]